LNNIVVSLYHENDNANRKFIDEVNQIIQNPPIVFEYKDLPNNEQINSNASAIMRRVIQIPLLAGDGFFSYNIDYYLKPWGPLGIPPPNVYYRIGIMDASDTWYDYGILRIGDEVEPIPPIKNIDSPYYPEIQIWGRNLNQNIHSSWYSFIQDVGGPVFQFLNLSTASLFGILTGCIGNIGLATNLDDIVRLTEVSPV
ncbi:4187_t:CDS:2, partial [Gigaspora rosea]